MYCLRHSSIVRMLLRNVPIRLVASLHNTSVAMIEKHYSKYITEHSDDVSRHALLQPESPVGENVVALARVIGGCDEPFSAAMHIFLKAWLNRFLLCPFKHLPT